MAIVFLMIACLYAAAFGEEEYHYVDTSTGRVRGQTVWIPEDTNSLYRFLGIPYAKPPVGELRFRKPEPAEAWEETLNADQMPPACVQTTSIPYPWFDKEPGKSEDCLYLNVYQPKPNGTTFPLVPVFFFIHGGGFLGGSNRMHYYDPKLYATDWDELAAYSDPEYIGNVVVTINYRLGAFGFLTTGTEDAPGNLALFDMLLALQWVKENAAAFNGDPDRITLYAQGAGAVAASLFCVSPLTEGLFSRIIIHSGSFLSVRENRLQENVRLSANLSQAVGCSEDEADFRDNPSKAVTCLQGIDANKLAEALNSMNPDALMSFYPQYDGELFPSDPVQAVKDGNIHDVALMLGFAYFEGGFILANMYPEVFGRFGEKLTTPAINETFARTILQEAFKSYPDPDSMATYYLNHSIFDHLTYRADSRYQDLQDDMKFLATPLGRTMRAIGDEAITCPAFFFAEKFGNLGYKNRVYVWDLRRSELPWAAWMRSGHFSDEDLLMGTDVKGPISREWEDGVAFTPIAFFLEHRLWAWNVEVLNDAWKPFATHNYNIEVMSFADQRYNPPLLRGWQGCGFLNRRQGFWD